MESNRQSRLWIATLILAMAWPPIYSIFVHPLVQHNLDCGYVSTGELKNLLDARRYTIDVPMELDGHFLTFDVIVDGKVTQGGGSSVVGGSKIVLLLRRDQESRKIEYCWIGMGTVRGVFDDPLERGATLHRENRWTHQSRRLVASRRAKGVQVYPATEPAEFEVRLAFIAR